MMSFAVPPVPEQYVQYANRMVKHQQDYAKVPGAARISLSLYSREELKEKARPEEKRTDQKAVSKVTGKGLLFSESI
ncbi:hypothetical protein RKD52_003306 [Metabacillus sp. SLBN-84]